MKRVIEFLRALSANNNKEWFNAHKDEYLSAKKVFEEFAERLIERIGEFDDSVRGLKVSDCTYRIYRDVRFNKDKSPYKTHFGCFICPGGKKSGYGGYYFHIATEQGDTYPTGHMLAVGDYCTDAKALQVLREDIADGEGDFENILTKQIDQCFRLDDSFRMKRPPKGFDADTPYIELLKYKAYCLSYEPSTDEILSPTLMDEVVAKFRSAKPFLDYVNRAIKYVKEGNDV